ncbi:MAG: hypothetical protein KAQ65_03215 [Candidatus Thorarchaeota archaeon]|nr:hypothetical protein [Candidatus Thorarchaeota archaeon]MCK5239213.1 hypothetical protein [Candidatus Thorarchaeota archaeon]
MSVGKRSFIAVTLLLSIISISLVPITVNGQSVPNTSLKTGPFLDKILYKLITQDDQQVLALYDDEIDIIGNMVDPAFLDTLIETEGLEVANVLRNGYGYISINTAKYPLNITPFRRAFAFALDKERISDIVWDGLSVPQDSCVPQGNPFSIEGLLFYDYYESNITLGNQLLDAAGFVDVTGDDFREAPDGSEFDVEIWCAETSNIGLEVSTIGVETLQALGVNAYVSWTDYYPYFPWYPSWRGDYDMVFLGSSFNNFDVDWLAYEFWSEYADEPYWNHPKWRNASYDSWRNQLLTSISYDEVYEAALEMQRIWVYECPMIITYQNIFLSAYWTEKFEGFVNDVHDGVPCWWTNYKVHLKEDAGGPFGGTLRVSNPLEVDTFNFMITSSQYTMNILQMTYDSLIKRGPDGLDIMWLAESYRIETHDDNPSITDGHTRITFQMLQNVTWSDGKPLTEEDVAFTLNYYRNSPGNPYGADLSDMTAAYSPRPHTVVVEFESESYWHLHTIGYKPIIPKHVFQEIGLNGWNLWEPDPRSDVMVTSGPFNITDYEPGEYVELTRNPNYFFGPDIPPTFEANTELINPGSWYLGFTSFTLQSGLITGISLCVILIVLVKWKLETRSS